jgi:Protein of unknown function (DUF2690)
MLRLKFRRAAAASAAALFMATAAIALPGAASAAQAAPAGLAAPSATDGPCWGHSCIGKSPLVDSNSQRDCVKGIANPYQGGYVDAAYDVVTIPTEFYGGTLTLRYSPLCAANWARFTGPKYQTQFTYWVETNDHNASGHEDSYKGSGYTTMVDGTLLARVCWYDAAAYYGQCSTWN